MRILKLLLLTSRIPHRYVVDDVGGEGGNFPKLQLLLEEGGGRLVYMIRARTRKRRGGAKTYA